MTRWQFWLRAAAVDLVLHQQCYEAVAEDLATSGGDCGSEAPSMVLRRGGSGSRSPCQPAYSLHVLHGQPLPRLIPFTTAHLLANRRAMKWPSLPLLRQTFTTTTTSILTLKVKCYRGPTSPSEFNPSDELAGVEEEIILESDSDIVEEVHPVDEDSNYVDDMKDRSNTSDMDSNLSNLIIHEEESLRKHIQNVKVSTIGVGVMRYIANKLTREFRKGRAFDGWLEGTLSFPLMYKYENYSDRYYEEDPKAGRRTPTWCDRILSHGKGFKLLNYRRTELKLFDHRPVIATFMVEVEVFCVRRLQRALTFTNEEVKNEEFEIGLEMGMSHLQTEEVNLYI
ncbi:Type IV inositol polyphosphate 5-phosphatase 3 [Linum perenne]